MKPSMHTRRKYDFESSSEELIPGQLTGKKKVTYKDLIPGDIALATPPPAVQTSQRNYNKQGQEGRSGVHYTTLGVTDGKPRARGTQKHLKDDDSIKRKTGIDNECDGLLSCVSLPPEAVDYEASGQSRGCRRSMVHDHSAVQGICEVLPFGKKQTLILNGKRMQILLGEPEIVGYTMSLDPTVYNLCRGLKAFFRDNRAGIMLTRVMKVVIWKDKICYYIFDPAGRDSKAYSNFSSGCAALINVKDIRSVAEVLLARSVVEDQKFVLASIKVLKMVSETCDEDFESDKELTQAEKAMMGYRILNENCAIVNANMHLGDRCFEDAKYRQALTIAVAAMTYAKISPPNTWFSKTLDKVLRFGNKLYVDCVHPKVLIDLTIDNIPNEIIIGPYACEIIIYRERVKGQLFTTKECLFNIRSGLQDFFTHEYSGGILEFNNYALAVWRQKDMYYLFDPYPRTTDGLRCLKVGRACCWMLLDPDAMAAVFTKNWDYLPTTTQFYIHAFKAQIICTLSDEQLPGAKWKLKRKVLHMSKAHGDGKELFHDVMPRDDIDEQRVGPQVDEEHMGEIISLVDSIQEDYLPPIPLRYKNAGPTPLEDRIVNLDSPTVSVTQEEEAEEEEDEETAKKRKEEEERKKAEEEEARRKAEELPPPMPPPPPSPQPEPEVPLAPAEVMEDEVQTLEPVNVDRRILLTEDARYRSKLRQLRKKMTQPLTEDQLAISLEEELAKPSNFKNLPDNTQIIRGTNAINNEKAIDVLPFAAIMAIVTSYKYSVNTWTAGIVNFVVDTAKKLYDNKRDKFQHSPMHIIPKIAIGHQAYKVTIDVAGEGPTWQMEDVLARKFLNKYDRGMITTSTYSCAFFMRNNLYYLFDASSCNAMGLREATGKGKSCFLRFTNLHDLVARVNYNRDGNSEDQQFILSRIIVRRLLVDPRMKLPEDYDFETGMPKSKKSKVTLADTGKTSQADKLKPNKKSATIIEATEPKSQMILGYQMINGLYRIEGTTSLSGKSDSSDVKSCHFVCLIAMLMATMHPIRTWDHLMIDTCIEKGLEIYEKATNRSVCEKRVIKNIILDGKFVNVNIKKILVVNENPEKTLEQYLKAVMKRLRYVIVRFPSCSLVICQTEGYYHLFDPYPPPSEPAKPTETPPRTAGSVASWTLYRDMGALIRRIKTLTSKPDSPEFFTFELTSVKDAPKRSALNYRLSPLFKPDENPNVPYLRRKRILPNVDEKMYWLNIDCIPWSRMSPVNDLGFERKTPKAMWKDWDIEFPGDLYSLWGSVHPLDSKFEEIHRGKQYLATCVVALVMAKSCALSAWTGNFLNGIVENGNGYHKKCHAKIGGQANYEIKIDDLDTKYDEMYPYSFSVKFEKIIFGFVYNIYPDRFNLSKALAYFFEKNELGVLVSPAKNLAFGKSSGNSYFMFDCQSYGAPVFCPGRGAAYILKCESLNRLIYCITLTLNIRRHGQQFHLYSANVTLTEKSK
ncbi:unnamed protein product [Leptidea sinapis]|uniref:Uncharacterized protein n=1 Tax=Leptidea sinapis TaxID=189913 RepID=A0A5E4PQS2_9NEOP|nr:unnamed protein product [Leptidea sinapis]